MAAEIMALAERSLQEVRTISYLLHPPLLDEIGLESALRWLAEGFGERSGIVVETSIDRLEASLPPAAATALFRVAQEALANIHRHSGSGWARVSLRRHRRGIELAVEDRGCGIPERLAGPGAESAIGVGISGMRVRLKQLGGWLELDRLQPGLRVRAMLPGQETPPPAALPPEAADRR
jgi:signal transduction histidine kinase